LRSLCGEKIFLKNDAISGFAVICCLIGAINDDNYSMRWRQIKSAFTRQLPATESCSLSRRKKGERGIWQRRFWEPIIRNETDYCHHVDYIHYNPVKHGYVKQVKDWKYSSFHRAVNWGIYPSNWCGEGINENLEGECLE